MHASKYFFSSDNVSHSLSSAAVDSYKQQIRMFLHMLHGKLHSRRNQQLMMLMTKKSEDKENNHNKRSLSNPRPSEKMNGNKLCAGEV